MDKKHKAINEIKLVLEIHNSILDPNLRFGEDRWDSMNHLNIMMILEKYGALEINETTIEKFQEMRNILEFIDELK